MSVFPEDPQAIPRKLEDAGDALDAIDVSGGASASTLEMTTQEKAAQGWRKRRPFGFTLPTSTERPTP